MKNLVLILIIAIFLKPIFPVIEYVVNYEYISKVLCENKAKPAMQCNGKCYLIKELSKVAENEKPISSDKKGYAPVLEILFFQEINTFYTICLSIMDKEDISIDYSNLYSNSHLETVFRPPIFIS